MELIETDRDWTKTLEIGDVFLVKDKKNVNNIYELELLSRGPSKYLKLIDRLEDRVFWDAIELLIFNREFIGFL